MHTRRTFGHVVGRLALLLIYSPLFWLDKEEGRPMFVDMVEHEFSTDELRAARSRIEELERAIQDYLACEADKRKALENQLEAEDLGQCPIW